MTEVCACLMPSRGFSLVELLVSLAVTLLVTSAVFAMLDPAGGAFQAQPEAADVLQRLRAGTDALRRDLIAAGNPPALALGDVASPIAAAVFPLRVGRRNPDAAGTFDSSRISFWTAGVGAPQARLASPLPSASGTTTINPGPACAGDSSCGFRVGSTVMLLSGAGAWDLYSVTNVAAGTLTLQHNLRDAAVVYPAGTTILSEVTMRTYFFREDRASELAQLMRYDGAGGDDVPVVDHIVSLHFEFYGDPDPPTLLNTAAEEPLRATYGPLPPAPGAVVSAYPAGENCVFARTAVGNVVPRLALLPGGPALVPLTPASLADGPWCPDAANPNRYDADLLRVRQVAIALRVESAVASLRGPAGPLFSRGGTARTTRFVPDRFTRLVVTPRALNAGR